MSSSQSQSNAGHPGQPEPAGNFDQSYPPPPLGPDFVIPPEEDYSDQNPPPPPPSSLTSEMYSTSYPANPTRHELKKLYSLLMTYFNQQWLIAAVFGTATITNIGFMTCVSSGRRESPMMWIFPLIDAGAVGISQSLIFAELPRDELLLVYGFGITSVVFFSLTLLAFWMKLDLTRLHTVLSE
ncbi:uncharacterized protein LOC122847776 [Aphidius gifuensis]|uniref:uncharacterized protein LOC122847776 n=1 Tax=Aphidius gifuensis TaxID=684658 RepID=UPI001CDD5AD0|nr:uncharacterized protein LOC122847776 [Aphidius gifuensis]